MRRISVGLAVLLLAGRAAAYSSTPQTIIYIGDKNLIGDINLDTGWVPAGSPIQVHFALNVGTGWSVQAGGKAHLTWPEALALSADGPADNGLLHMNLGITVVARLRICEPLPNCDTLHWEGDVPFIPNFDYSLRGDALFKPFLLPGASPDSAVVSDSIDPVVLFQVDLLSLIGVSIPGVSGGFELKAGGELTSTLTGVRFDIEDGLGGVLGTIEHDPGAYVLPVPTLGHLDTYLNWHANLNAKGTLELQPAVYVEFAGNTWDLALFTIPIDLIDVDIPWDFGTKKATFPLPDIRVPETTVDFGAIPAGVQKTHALRIDNRGELALEVDATPSGDGFGVESSSLTVGPGATGYLNVTVTAPARNITGTLRLETSDPDQPVVEVALLAAGEGDVEQVPGDGGVYEVPPDVKPAGGCGCHAAPLGGAGFALLVLPLLARRRRR